MTRSFVGTRNGGGFSGKSAKDIFIRKMRGQDDAKMTSEQRYDKMMNDKLNELQSAVKKAARYSVMLPGTEKADNARQISKTAQDVIDKLAKERAKKYAKKNQFRNMTIKARYIMGIQGGRLDAKGKIYGPDGKYIAYVCKKTGKVKNKWGNTICKYSESGYCDYKIAKFIAWMYDKRRMKTTPYGNAGVKTLSGGAFASNRDGVYGGAGAGGNSGSGWGGNTGGFWGGGGSDSGGTGGFWG